VNVNLEVDRGTTCGALLASAAALNATSDQCANARRAASVCCPIPAQVPCDFCPAGLPVGLSASQSRLCEYNLFSSAYVEDASADCAAIKNTTDDCCPTTTPAVEDPCVVCPDGLAVDEDYGLGRGMTCGSLRDSARGRDAASDVCASAKTAEAVCCPAPCPVCPDGLSVDAGVVISERANTTCGGLVVDAPDVDRSSETCRAMESAADNLCCPPPDAGANATSTDSSAPETSAVATNAPSASVQEGDASAASEDNTPAEASAQLTTAPVPAPQDNTMSEDDGLATASTSSPTTPTAASEDDAPVDAPADATIPAKLTPPPSPPPAATAVSTASPVVTAVKATASPTSMTRTAAPARSPTTAASSGDGAAENVPVVDAAATPPTDASTGTCLVADGFPGLALVRVALTCWAVALMF